MSIKKLVTTALTALTLSATSAVSAGGGGHIDDTDFSFESPFGTYDQAQLRRGLQVYTEVCSSCHGMQYVPLRTLGDEGGPHMSSEAVREFSTQFEAPDTGPDAELGDTRDAIPTDHFPMSADPNAPDLSLMAKARAGYHGPYGLGLSQLVNGMGGPEYILSILAGYTGEEKEEAGTTYYENTTFPGGWISMPPPLYGEDVDYPDGHSNSLHHEAEDVSAFLMWAAEPKMMARKKAGFIGVLMLTLLSVLLYATNKRIWAPVKQRAKDEAANS